MENVQKILAIELMMATHALHCRRKEDPNFRIPPNIATLFEQCSAMSPIMTQDRYLNDDFEAILQFVKTRLPLDPKFVFGR